MASNSAYGSYNDLVLEVAGARSQTVVNWDLEYVCWSTFLQFKSQSNFSSGDSQSFSAEQQKKVYDDAVAGHPNTLLSLQHEVYGQYSSFYTHTAPYLSFYRLFSVSINSSILETSFQPTKFFCSLIVTTYYHTRFRFYKALDTSWSLSQNAWVRNPIRVLVLQRNVMCVFTSSHRYTCAILISRSRRPGSASRVRLLVFPDVVNIPIVVLPITHER